MLSFSNKKELYDRVLPALDAKVRALHILGNKMVTADDVWNYLIANKWIKSNGLTLYDIVDDILHLDPKEIDIYLKNKSHF